MRGTECKPKSVQKNVTEETAMGFRSFLDELDRAGLIKHVHDPVNAFLEATERCLGRRADIL